MQLAILVAVVGALASAEMGGEPVDGLAWRLPLVAVSTLLAPLVALLGAQRLVHACERASGLATPASDPVDRLQNLVVLLWLGTVAVVLLAAQWPRIVRSNWELASLPLVDELAILAPVLASLVLIWCALYRLERAARLAATSACGAKVHTPRLGSYLALHARHHLGLVVLPALVVLGLFELLQRAIPSADEASLGIWIAMPALAAMLVLLPLAVRRIWRTTPLPAGPLRDALEAVCRERGTRVRDILTWHTDGYAANAAVVGLARPLRYVLLTDVLLSRLPAAEIAAVLRHELGHLRRGHLPLRLALLLLPVAWWLAANVTWPTAEATASAWLAAAGISAPLASAAIVPAAMLLYAVLVVGWYSRQLELDADLDACLDASGRFEAQWGDDFAAALVRLTGGREESRWTRWLHPTLIERLTHLDRASSDGSYIRSFRGQLKLIARAMILLYAAAIALLIV